jgi:hypothetical protein
MTRSTDIQGKQSASRQRLIRLLASFMLLSGTPWYSNAKPQSSPVSAQTSINQQPSASTPLLDPVTQAADEHRRSVAPVAAFAPFLDIVPESNGTDLLISAGGVGELGGTVVANIGIGPGGNKGGWTMIYSNTAQTYFATATGFTPGQDASGIPLNITTTLGLDTGLVRFNRAYIPASTAQTITSVDNNLQLNIVTTDTLTSEAYVAVVPSFAPPGPAPVGHRFVSNVYSVRASGALVVASKPMLLHLAYDPAALAGADPHTLAIFAWDTNTKQWSNLGGQLLAAQSYVSVATPGFTTYALMSTTTWQDDFDDFNFSGLDLWRTQNITLDLQGDSLALALQDIPGQGVAVSRPITSTSVISGWGTLTFTGTALAPATTLTVDVLDADGTTVLLANAAGNTSLTGIDPAQHPVIRLRARLESTAAGQSPKLDGWQVTWLASGVQRRFYIYMPMMVK